jgi:hypothetical protein
MPVFTVVIPVVILLVMPVDITTGGSFSLPLLASAGVAVGSGVTIDAGAAVGVKTAVSSGQIGLVKRSVQVALDAVRCPSVGLAVRPLASLKISMVGPVARSSAGSKVTVSMEVTVSTGVTASSGITLLAWVTILRPTILGVTVRSPVRSSVRSSVRARVSILLPISRFFHSFSTSVVFLVMSSVVPIFCSFS